MSRRIPVTALLLCGCTSTTTPDAAIAPDAFVLDPPEDDAPFARPDAYRPPAVATHATQAAVTSLLSPLDDEQVTFDGTCLGSYRLDAWEDGVYGGMEPSPINPTADYGFLGEREPNMYSTLFGHYRPGTVVPDPPCSEDDETDAEEMHRFMGGDDVPLFIFPINPFWWLGPLPGLVPGLAGDSARD